MDKPTLSIQLKDGQFSIEVNSDDEALLALALRKLTQAVDFHMFQLEAKKRKEQSNIIQATQAVESIVPNGLLDKLRG